jgi:hypothetical protein
MTPEQLKECNKKALAKLARDQGIVGWHAMRKDQLLRALTPLPGKKKGDKAPVAAPAAAVRPPRRNGKPVRNGHHHEAPATPPAPPRILPHTCVKDRVVVMVRDAYWLHAYWELSRSTLARAQAALGQEWHAARPILRLMDVTSEDTTSGSERHVRDIPIHGGVSNWFLDVHQPPRSFRVDIGYLSRKGKFYVLARSNVVTTPKAGATDMFDQNWLNLEKDYERLVQQTGQPHDKAEVHSALRELFEDRLRRPINGGTLQSLGAGAFTLAGRDFHFEIDAELIVFGTTEPTARVTLQGEQVPVRPDGSFSVRFALPDARQIIPAVATSVDGVEERTIVLAVERNTKELEPMIHDGNDI